MVSGIADAANLQGELWNELNLPCRAAKAGGIIGEGSLRIIDGEHISGHAIANVLPGDRGVTLGDIQDKIASFLLIGGKYVAIRPEKIERHEKRHALVTVDERMVLYE